MPTYTETDFEEHIEQHLKQSGYRSLQSSHYNKSLCLIPSETLRFIQLTQLTAYQKLERQYEADTPDKLLDRISREIKNRGVLDVLRKGVRDRGCHFNLTYFLPSSGMNPDHQKLYNQNRFSLIRQLKYSEKNEKSLDMVLFLNGLPLATMELKNSLTGQTVTDAEKQYRTDRDPREPLFKFKRCLVHFAVGNEKVSMTTTASTRSCRNGNTRTCKMSSILWIWIRFVCSGYMKSYNSPLKRKIARSKGLAVMSLRAGNLSRADLKRQLYQAYLEQSPSNLDST